LPQCYLAAPSGSIAARRRDQVATQVPVDAAAANQKPARPAGERETKGSRKSHVALWFAALPEEPRWTPQP